MQYCEEHDLVIDPEFETCPLCAMEPEEGRQKARQGMPKGYKFPIETCHECGRQVPANWLVRHLRANCSVPAPRIYEVSEEQR